MAFILRNLSVLAYAQGFTLWHYKAPDNGGDEARDPGFFDQAADMLALGDMLMVSSSLGGRLLCVARADTPVITAPVA